MFRLSFYVSSPALIFLTCGLFAADANLQESLTAINGVSNAGVGHRETISAWQIVGKQSADSLPVILKSIDETKPLGANWIRGAVDQIAERALQNGRVLPTKQLERIVFDASYAPRARRLAYEWLVRVDAAAEGRIIPKMLNDSSLEMRRDAVDLVMSKAENAASDDAAKEHYRTALTAARDTDQIDKAFEKLTELGEVVDLPKHFGFITDWDVIGPFDNRDKKGYAVAYPPEREINLTKSYDAKEGSVKWAAHQTKDKYGMVDFNTAIGKHMGAAAYAVTTFVSDQERDVDLRLGSVCAAKVWLNGKQVMDHEVYHSGDSIDQYITRGMLQQGENTILLKICQNEQTQSWAQDWQFQLRICDSVGTAILSKNRK